MRLELTPLKHPTWEVINNFVIDTPYGTFIVRKGFRTDLASTPRFLWWLIPPSGEYIEASVVHDFLYKKKIVNRETADKVFQYIMLKYKTRIYKIKLMYLGVRIFGSKHYKKNEN